MFFYILFEFFLLILILLTKNNSNNIELLNVLTFLPIIITNIYAQTNKHRIEKNNSILWFSLISAFFGDLLLIYFSNVLGIFFFFITQCCFFLYLNDFNKQKMILSIIILNALICVLFKNKVLILEGILYAIISLYNTIKSLKLVRKDEISIEYLASFFFLLLCDTSLLIISGLEMLNINTINSNFLFTIEWISYILFQIIISLTITNHYNEKLHNILNNFFKPFI